MRRRTLAAVLGALLALFVAGTGPGASATAAAAPGAPARMSAPALARIRASARAARTAAAARLLVYAQEWSLWPSRSRLPAGRVIVELWNRGQDAHDLRIRRLNRQGRMVGRTQGVGVTASGQIREATWRLRPGHYELYCSMPGHMKLGMHARLTVR